MAAAARALETAGASEVPAIRWQEALTAAIGQLPAAARVRPDANRKSAAWKVAVAAHLKGTTDVSNGWLASQLDMGTPAYVSKHVGLLQRSGGLGKRWLDQLKKVNGET
jgi:hypothetical protein